MKKLLAFSLISVFSFSANVMAKSKYTGDINAVCKVEIKGNNSEYSSLEKIKFTEKFKISEYGRGRLKYKLFRLYPDFYLNADDTEDDTKNFKALDKNQVVMMLRNKDVLQKAVEEDAFDEFNYEKDTILNKLYIAVRNNNSTDSISVDITSPGGALKNQNFNFKKGKTEDVKIKVPIVFGYDDYELKGFLGIPSLFEDGNEKYESKTNKKQHKGKVELKCSFKRVKSSAEIEEETPAPRRVRKNTRRSGSRRES